MKHTKKLTATALALAIAAASSAVAFADTDVSTGGTGGSGGSGGGGSSSASTFSVTITADAQKDGAFLIVPQEMTVTSNKAEEYGFTDSNKGVTVLDAIITMHELKYGEAFTAETISNYFTTDYNEKDNYYYLSKTFGEPATKSGYFINSELTFTTCEKAVLNDGDRFEYAFYLDTEAYTDTYTAFSPDRVSAVAGEPITLDMLMNDTVAKLMWGAENKLVPIEDEYEFEAFTINTVEEDGSLSEALKDSDETLIVPDDKGVVTLTFDKPGTYIVTASGFIGEDYPVIAPYCFVTVKPEPTTVKVTMDVQKGGAFLLVPQEIEVSSFTAEKYGFSDSFDGVTFLDALVAVHEMKYGEAFTAETVGDYLTSGVNPAYGTYYINTAFREPASATLFYINSTMGNDTAEAALLSSGDTVEYCFFQNGWSDVYTTFDKKAATVLVDAPIMLTMSKMDTWTSEMLPIDGTDKDNALTINTVNADGSVSEAIADATPNANGQIALSFDKPGTYIVTAQGTVNGGTAIFAPYCFVTVKPQYTLDNITIRASAKVTKADGAEDAIVVLAIYDKYGVLKGTETKPAESGNIDLEKEIPNGSFVKMFIWNNMNDMKPLAPIE